MIFSTKVSYMLSIFVFIIPLWFTSCIAYEWKYIFIIQHHCEQISRKCYFESEFKCLSNHPIVMCVCVATFMHSADSSSELLDLHTTQTWASQAHASVVTQWLPACLFKLLSREHQRKLNKTSKERRPHLNQYLSDIPHSIRFFMHSWYSCSAAQRTVLAY